MLLSRRDILRYGLYGVLTASLCPFFLSNCWNKQFEKKPNIILITLDTTRADRLGCYRYYRKTSPNLDNLATESVLYTKAIAPSSWTLPSHASLFTGKFTASHGARFDPQGPLHLSDAIQGSQALNALRARGLAQNELTLVEILKNEGYTTAAVVGGPWLKRVFGLDKGFDFYDDSQINTLRGRSAKQVTIHALNLMKEWQERLFFLFLNYFDPHYPYMPPEEFARTFLPDDTDLSGENASVYIKNALYDAEIFYMDYYIGQLLQYLKSSNLYDKTWIIITADHGELLGEHGAFGHGKYLYQEEIHIPLVMKYPQQEECWRIDAPIQLMDLFPMILQRLGINAPKNIQGGMPPHIGHPILSEVYPVSFISKEGDWRAIFDGDYKFIWNSRGNHLLFNLKNDPGEKLNLASQELELAANLFSKLNQYISNLPLPGSPSPTKSLDEDTKKALKSLGYVNQ